MRRGDALAALALLLLAAAVWLLRGVQSEPSAVQITAQGESRTYALSEDMHLQLDDGVVVEIADGQAWIAQSPCRDQICVRAGKLSKTGETACCLPQRVSIEIRGAGSRTADEVDGVAG